MWGLGRVVLPVCVDDISDAAYTILGCMCRLTPFNLFLFSFLPSGSLCCQHMWCRNRLCDSYFYYYSYYHYLTSPLSPPRMGICAWPSCTPPPPNVKNTRENRNLSLEEELIFDKMISLSLFFFLPWENGGQVTRSLKTIIRIRCVLARTRRRKYCLHSGLVRFLVISSLLRPSNEFHSFFSFFFHPTLHRHIFFCFFSFFFKFLILTATIQNWIVNFSFSFCSPLRRLRVTQ